MAYTIRDTPDVVARVEADLARAVEVVRAADPRLRALVLTGAFARGEGAAVAGVPQNDYDLVAVRGIGSPRRPYEDLRDRLEKDLGVHVDLAPVAAWRLRWVSPSIFWYETALRGRVLWGENLLGRIPVRTQYDLHPSEGLRLLVNRAAGLLLADAPGSPWDRRIQTSKAFLAALDVWMLAQRDFAPSQRERWERFTALRHDRRIPQDLARLAPWIDWAFHVKVDPSNAPARELESTTRLAARAILDSVPRALAHAELGSLSAYEKQDGLVDRVVYFRRARRIPGARRLVRHPTGRVRVATLRLLEASLNGEAPQAAARRTLGHLVPAVREPTPALEALRRATLQ